MSIGMSELGGQAVPMASLGALAPLRLVLLHPGADWLRGVSRGGGRLGAAVRHAAQPGAVLHVLHDDGEAEIVLDVLLLGVALRGTLGTGALPERLRGLGGVWQGGQVVVGDVTAHSTFKG